MEKPQLKSTAQRHTQWTDGSFRHQFFLILSPFMLNLQTVDSCIMLFDPQLCTKSIFLLDDEKKTLHRKNSTQYQTHAPDHKVQSETKRRALSFHRAAWWHLRPQHTWLYTFKQVITLPEENVSFLSPLVWTLPFHKLPWTGQAGTRGEIHQMQTSWLSPSTEKEMMKEISDIIYFPSYTFCQDCCLGQETICCDPGDPGDFFFHLHFSANGTC